MPGEVEASSYQEAFKVRLPRRPDRNVVAPRPPDRCACRRAGNDELFNHRPDVSLACRDHLLRIDAERLGLEDLRARGNDRDWIHERHDRTLVLIGRNELDVESGFQGQKLRGEVVDMPLEPLRSLIILQGTLIDFVSREEGHLWRKKRRYIDR